MAIVINGSGTVTGLAVGGLPDGTIDAGTVAADVATQSEIDAKLNLAGGTVTGVLINKAPSSGSATLQTFKNNAESVVGEIKYDDTASTRGLQIGTTTQHELVFKTDNTQRLHITYNGRGVSQFTAKGWCKFTGVSTTAILDSHNVSSITDNGTGSTTVIWDVNLSNANYAVGTNAPKPGGTASASNSNHCNVGEANAGQILFETNRADGITKRDLPENSVIAFGD